MAARPIAGKHRYIQYTGNNTAELHAEIPIEVISEENGVLVAMIPANGSQQWTIPTNNYVIYWDAGVIEINTPYEFGLRWRCTSLCSEVTAAVGSPIRGIGVASVPLLLASQSTTVSVTLDPAMPNAGYAAIAKLFAGVNIGDLEIDSVTVIDENTVDVEVHNTGLASLSGASVLVFGSA